MARYVSALLGGGAGEPARILQPETVGPDVQPHYQPDPRVPGVGLAFLRAELGGHPVVEHQGVLPGFDAQSSSRRTTVWASLGFTNGAHHAVVWLRAELGRLLSDLLGVPVDASAAMSRTTLRCGPSCAGGTGRARSGTTLQAWALAGAGVEVAVRRGQLRCEP